MTPGATTATTISLSWTGAGSEIDSYVVMWETDNVGGCSGGSDMDSTTITDGSTSYDITELEEDSTYSITVIASNIMNSVNSEAINGMTQETSEPIFIVSSFIYTVSLYTAPTGPPIDVSATSSSTSITVQWQEVECILRNGDITGYTMQYREVGSGSIQTVNVTDRTITISGLTTSTTYTYQVAAMNSAGIGVYSDFNNITTDSKLNERLSSNSK